jgi:hypothetical protein
MTEGSTISNHNDRCGWRTPTFTFAERCVLPVFIDADKIFLQVFEVSLLGAMQMPIRRIETRIKVRFNTRFDESCDYELSAIHSLTVNPRHVMIGREEPTTGCKDDIIRGHIAVSSVGTNG